MNARLLRARPFLVPPDLRADRCLRCDARHRSVCNIVDDEDLAKLADVAVAMEISRGEIFIHEGEPAQSFFNITLGTAKLFKLLPDGRQQITGFASAGHFLGLAVSTTGPSRDLGDHDDRDRTSRICCRLGIHGWNGRCVWLGWGWMVNPGVSR